MKPNMSSREWIFRITDIYKSVKKIEEYTRDMTLAQFYNDELVFDATVRNFEIIGEASKNIPLQIRRAHPDIPWEQMNGMRNVLIHEYFGVDLETIWYTAKHHLPKLKKQLEVILHEHEQG